MTRFYETRLDFINPLILVCVCSLDFCGFLQNQKKSKQSNGQQTSCEFSYGTPKCFLQTMHRFLSIQLIINNWPR